MRNLLIKQIAELSQFSERELSTLSYTALELLLDHVRHYTI